MHEKTNLIPSPVKNKIYKGIRFFFFFYLHARKKIYTPWFYFDFLIYSHILLSAKLMSVVGSEIWTRRCIRECGNKVSSAPSTSRHRGCQVRACHKVQFPWSSVGFSVPYNSITRPQVPDFYWDCLQTPTALKSPNTRSCLHRLFSLADPTFFFSAFLFCMFTDRLIIRLLFGERRNPFALFPQTVFIKTWTCTCVRLITILELL